MPFLFLFQDPLIYFRYVLILFVFFGGGSSLTSIFGPVKKKNLCPFLVRK